jgi:hypothetical protein
MKDIYDAEIEGDLIPVKEPSVIMSDGEQHFQNAVEYTKRLEDSNEELLRDNKIPDRDVAKLVSSTELSIDLSLASQAKQLSHKLLKLEHFLSKIEDRLFNDETIASLNEAELMQLYTNTRMMKQNSFQMLKEIRKEVDFDKLEVSIMALNAKGDMKSADDGNVNDVLEKIMASDNFLDAAVKAQLDEIEKEDKDKKD